MKRILVVNPYGIGDVLFMTPLLKALKSFPGVEKVDVLLGSRTESVLKNNSSVDNIYYLNKDDLKKIFWVRRAVRLLSFYSKLRKNKYDTYFDLSLTREYSFFAKFFLSVPKRIGFDYKNRGTFLNFKQALPQGFSEKKVPEYYAGLLKFVDREISSPLEMEFPVHEDLVEKKETYLTQRKVPRGGRILAVSAGGGDSWGKDAHFKQWPPHFFKELIHKIHVIFPLDAVILVGGKNDIELNNKVTKGLRVPFHNLTGEITLEETVAFLKISSLVLVNEGGLYHLASSQKTPVIALVGPVDEKVYGSVGGHPQLLITKEGLECRPCYQLFRYKSECTHRACLQELSPEEAFQKISNSGFLKNVETGSNKSMISI